MSEILRVESVSKRFFVTKDGKKDFYSGSRPYFYFGKESGENRNYRSQWMWKDDIIENDIGADKSRCWKNYL